MPEQSPSRLIDIAMVSGICREMGAITCFSSALVSREGIMVTAVEGQALILFAASRSQLGAQSGSHIIFAGISVRDNTPTRITLAGRNSCRNIVVSLKQDARTSIVYVQYHSCFPRVVGARALLLGRYTL